MLERSRKNRHAVELGRKGGLVGGKARAARLSPERRRAIAVEAARARWNTPVRSAGTNGRDASRTKQRILDAARREFVRRGVDGGRLDRIAAAAAGVNKRMIYYYFGSKDGLFREMLARNLSFMADVETSSNAGDDFAQWQELLASRPAWLRLSMWEALSDAGQPYVAAQERRAFWGAVVEELETAQKRGEMPVIGSTAQLQLTLIAVVMFPFLLPQLARFVTGLDPTDPQFLADRAEHLRALATMLTSFPAAPAS